MAASAPDPIHDQPTRPAKPGGARTPLAIQGGGHDRFGPIIGLEVYQRNTLGLARHFAEKYGLGDRFEVDPEVTVACTLLAVRLQRVMILLQNIEKDVAERAEAADGDYGMALFKATMAERHAKVNAEIDRNHRAARALREELEALAREIKAPPE